MLRLSLSLFQPVVINDRDYGKPAVALIVCCDLVGLVRTLAKSDVRIILTLALEHNKSL